MAKTSPRRSVIAKKSAPNKKKAAKKNSLTGKKKGTISTRKLPNGRSSGKFVITTKDIIKVLDLNVRTAQRLLQRTRTALDKEKNDYVTVREFCMVNKFDENEFQQRLNN